jgi:hypothetical protein
MPARWSAESVLALAPDELSRRAAKGLAWPSPWSGTGAAGELVWGLCAGSGANPYQVIADLGRPAYKCTCPSRKLPCKHALGLLLNWANGTVPEQAAPADYATAWLESRQARAAKVKAKAEVPATGNGAVAGAAARRAEQRAQRVGDGLAELREWLRDQVRLGFAATAAGRGEGGTETIAARMVDAQAPGVAGVLRGLAAVQLSGEGWPTRLLGEYGLLHLLTRAHERIGELPPGLAAVVRSHIGYTTSRQDVLTLPAVTDHWLVTAVRDLVDGTVPGRRVWLLGRRTGRFAMLLAFAGNGSWQDPEVARLLAGTELHADLHFYPGQPMRALTGEQHAPPAKATPPEPGGDIGDALADWAAGLEQDPWLTTWPVLLTGTPVPPAPTDATTANPEATAAWQLTDRTGAALPLAERESLWTLLAVSGGHPVTVAGEWHPRGLIALTAWHGDQAVPL